MAFKKGQSGNPKGRQPIILPEVQKVIDANRNAIKILILQKIDPKVGEWIDNIISQGIHEGDVIKFKMLMEMALGKMVADVPEFEVSDEEKALIIEYRRRKKEQDERIAGERIGISARTTKEGSTT